MNLDLRATSELEAVNLMLGSIGESPINALEDNGIVDAVMARRLLTATSRRVQSRGWHWNTDKALTLPLSHPEKHVKLPGTCLKVDTVGASAHLDVASRGDRLYDRRRHTFEFEDPVTVDIVQMLDFDELPEPARQYVLLSAGRKFQESVVGSEVLARFAQRDEIMAWSDLVNDESEGADLSIFDGLEMGR